MHQHRSVLTLRESAADVAVVYSLPTLMFRRYDALKTPDHHRLTRFRETTELLERMHVPFDVVIFGHPEIWDDDDTFRRIKERYKMVLLPGVDALTEQQTTLLSSIAEDGTSILAEQDLLRHDDNLNIRASAPPQLKTLPITPENIRNSLPQERTVEIQAPTSVSVNAWLSCRKRSLDVHLVNYDVDVQGEQVRPAKNIKLRVKIPDTVSLSRCIVSQPNMPDQEIPFDKNGSFAQVTLPELGGYAIVSFTDARMRERIQEMAERLRERDREKVKATARQHDLY
jgi:hypothetical protein